MNSQNRVGAKSIDIRLQDERIDTLRRNLTKGSQNQVGETSFQVEILIKSPGSLDIVKRKKALADCTWMSDEQKTLIEITEQGIKIAHITLALNDEENKMSYKKAKYLVPTVKHLDTIFDTIGGNDEQRSQFFRQVLKMEENFYWTSTPESTKFARYLQIRDTFISSTFWDKRKEKLHVRSLKNLS